MSHALLGAASHASPVHSAFTQHPGFGHRRCL